jgi:hypothetical protein
MESVWGPFIFFRFGLIGQLAQIVATAVGCCIATSLALN